MTFYTEAGLSYFNEDFRTAADQSSFRARVSMKLDWPLFDGRVTLYHYNEIFPSIENASDFFLTMDNGIRLKIVGPGQRLSGDHALQQSAARRNDRHRSALSVHVGI